MAAFGIVNHSASQISSRLRTCGKLSPLKGAAAVLTAGVNSGPDHTSLALYAQRSAFVSVQHRNVALLANLACAPKRFSIRRNRLNLLTRSLQQPEPVMMRPAPVATVRSERCPPFRRIGGIRNSGRCYDRQLNRVESFCHQSDLVELASRFIGLVASFQISGRNLPVRLR